MYNCEVSMVIKVQIDVKQHTMCVGTINYNVL